MHSGGNIRKRPENQYGKNSVLCKMSRLIQPGNIDGANMKIRHRRYRNNQRGI